MKSPKPVGPPVRFADAEKINPFQLLLDLHDHVLTRPAKRGRDDTLTELALSAAVVSWRTRWRPLLIHAALRAGADLTDIAAATGQEPGDLIRRWRRWVDTQSRLDIGDVRPWTSSRSSAFSDGVGAACPTLDAACLTWCRPHPEGPLINRDPGKPLRSRVRARRDPVGLG
jgi:hypothetical protein